VTNSTDFSRFYAKIAAMLNKNANLVTQKVIVNSHARLHFGFYDLTFKPSFMPNESKEKQHFGSVGLSIDAPSQTMLIGLDEAQAAETSPELAPLLQQFCQQFEISAPVFATLQQAIPRHAGLGSGTQLALALGAGLNQLFDLGLSVAQIAQVFMRGVRSGIGIGAFAQGGFLVDAGKTTNETIPPILERVDFPADWRIILVSDEANIGVHGEPEKLAFNNLPKIKNNLQDIVFKGLLPAVKRQDLLAFGAFMHDLQAYNGAYFAPVQGGHYASKKVENVLNWLKNNGVACVGQSSWGPTGFAVVESEARAKLLVQAFEAEFGIIKPLNLQVVRASNHGAQIQTV
jgi:beta-ribofuranosylaminobenzene 5'-phosphate synthase